ncbi:MAG: hypothetical protein EAX96_03340 [Candidatus Lokiarchaeota archaeon]|nr:hypothetical protein [Candidatus Lokiarchaeota archaeon]
MGRKIIKGFNILNLLFLVLILILSLNSFNLFHLNTEKNILINKNENNLDFRITESDALKYATGAGCWLESEKVSEHGGYKWEDYEGSGSYHLSKMNIIGPFLINLYETTQNITYLELSKRLADWYIGEATSENNGYKWESIQGNGKYEPLKYDGASGAGNFFLALYNITLNNTYLNYAKGAFQWIISKAVSENGGYKWLRADNDQYFTGMYTGAAGVGWDLFNAYQITNNVTYLNYAKGAAQWLKSVAISESGGYKWDYFIGDNNFQIGYPSGTSGIGDFFLKGYQITGDSTYFTFVEGALNWIINKAQIAGNGYYWPASPSNTNHYTGLVGASGVGTFFLNVYNYNQDTTCLNYIKGAANWLISEAVSEFGGYKWKEIIEGDVYNPAYEVGNFLLNLYRSTGNVTYNNYNEGHCTWLMQSAISDSGGYKWVHDTSYYRTGIISEIGQYFLNQIFFNYSDDFSSTILSSKWRWHNDSSNLGSWSLSDNPGNLRISSPVVAISWQSAVLDIPYMYQSLPSGDWILEIHLNEPAYNEHANGIILYKDTTHWMIFANHYDSVGEMNLLRINDGNEIDNIAGGGRGNNKPYLRLNKTGSIYHCFGSDDGNSWDYFGNFTSTTNYLEVGIWSQSHSSSIFNSDFDYFLFEYIPTSSTDNPQNNPDNLDLIIILIILAFCIIGAFICISLIVRNKRVKSRKPIKQKLSKQKKIQMVQTKKSEDREALKEITVKREYEHFGGQIRFKIGVENNANQVITSINIQLNIPEALKLVRHEPSEFELIGEVIKIPKIGIYEKKSITLYLEPISCFRSKLDAIISFSDAKDEKHAIAMKPKGIEIVCPLFLTEEDVNVASLKQLHRRNLNRECKILPIDERLILQDIFNIAISAILKHNVKLVYQDFKEGIGEAYFYGKTKVKKKQIAIILTTIKDARILEIEVSGEYEEQLTGFLAEIENNIAIQMISRGLLKSRADLIDIRACIFTGSCPYCKAPIKADLIDQFKSGKSINCPYCEKGIASY